MEPTNTNNRGEFKNQPIHRERPRIPDDGYDVDTHSNRDDSTLHRVEAKFERLYDHVENMVTTQVELARTEIGEKVERVEQGMISLTSGGMTTFFGVQFILFGVVFALALVLPLWGSALIVGGVVLAIGLALLGKAKKDLDPNRLKPSRTMRSVRETGEAIRREI